VKSKGPFPLLWLLVSFVLGCILAFVMLTLGTFREHPPAGLIPHLIWVGPAVVGAIPGYLQPVRPWRWAVASVTAIPIADIVNLVQEVTKDPTSHNLAPIEIIGVTGVAAVFAMGGAYGGAWIRTRRQ